MEKPDAGIAIGFGVSILRHSTQDCESLLEGLYDEYAQALYGYAFSILGTAEDAEDAVQEVFVRIARERGRAARVRNRKAYLFTAVRNSAYGILRQRQRAGKLHEAVCADMLCRPASRETADPELAEAFSQLPVEQREVLVLKVFDGMTLKEIARMTGTSLNTVGSRYRYGISKLREALGKTRQGEK